MIKTFTDFLDKKHRDMVHQLDLIKKVLDKHGMTTESFLHDEESPYIFCFSPSKGTSFDGIRLYKIGNEFAYRIQKEDKTHPYGKAYPLHIEEMFRDLLSEKDTDQKAAGMKVIDLLGKQIKKFFEKSLEAEQEERNVDNKSAGNVMVSTTGTDYSSLVYNKA